MTRLYRVPDDPDDFIGLQDLQDAARLMRTVGAYWSVYVIKRGVVAVVGFTGHDLYHEWLKRAESGRDPRIIAIRNDSKVGVGTCSVVDECWTDAEILQALDESSLRSVKSAVSWAREVHQNFVEREQDCRFE